MKTTENPDAVFEAAVLNWNILTQRWELAVAGTFQECQRYWEQVRLEGYGGRMQLIHQQRRMFTLPKDGELHRDYSQREKPNPQPSKPECYEWVAPFQQCDFYQDGAGVFRDRSNHGMVANVQVFDRELTPDEVEELTEKP